MNIQSNVKDYYGKKLQSSDDLLTDACCTLDETPAWLRAAFANIHQDVSSRYFGCGFVAPQLLDGAKVLDLGCGAGRDVYALAQLVGAKGHVVGVDMTPEQLAVARNAQDWHAERFGFANVSFLEGDIERLDALDLPPASFDVIVSNCVINLVEDKRAVFKAARALLKPGGEFYFSDVYADRRLPEALRSDPVAQAECLGGALYWNDFLGAAADAGFPDPRLVSHRPLAINDAALSERLAPARFYAATYRLFALDGLDRSCEDYGQAVIYKGGAPHQENAFALDNHHVIERGRVFPVCRNTYRMLRESRFAPWFEFIGDGKTHFGLFEGCGESTPFQSADSGAADDASGCCQITDLRIPASTGIRRLAAAHESGQLDYPASVIIGLDPMIFGGWARCLRSSEHVRGRQVYASSEMLERHTQRCQQENPTSRVRRKPHG